MSIRIRQAEESDIPWLMYQLAAFADFFGSARSLFPDDTVEARGIIEGMLAHPFFVAEDDDHGAAIQRGIDYTQSRGESVRASTRLGFIAGTLTPHPYNPAITVLAETFWWVDPAHRGTRAGAMLLRAFEDYGRSHADWIVMTLEDVSPVKEETLTKRGYRLKERSYLLEVNVPAEVPA